MEIAEKHMEITKSPALARFLLIAYVGWITSARMRCMPRGIWKTRYARVRKKLEEMGLIRTQIERSPRGRYVRYAYLTEEGEKVVKALLREHLDL